MVVVSFLPPETGAYQGACGEEPQWGHCHAGLEPWRHSAALLWEGGQPGGDGVLHTGQRLYRSINDYWLFKGGKQTCFSTLLLFSMYKLEIPGSMGGEINLGGEKSLCSPPSTKNQLCIHHTASQTCIETILRISLANGHCVVKWCNVYISPWSLPGQKCWWVKLLLYRSSIGSTVISLYVESIRELSHGRFWSWTSLVW